MSYRVTITNGRGIVRETVRRVYDATDADDAKRQAYVGHPYRYGWRVKEVEVCT